MRNAAGAVQRAVCVRGDTVPVSLCARPRSRYTPRTVPELVHAWARLEALLVRDELEAVVIEAERLLRRLLLRHG